MIVALWITLRIVFFVAAAFLVFYYLKSLKSDGFFDIFKNGWLSALKDCGFRFSDQKNYPIDVYKWTINERDDVCEESLDRTTWPAMDIADWMKEGLPRYSDGSSLCGRDCRCKLTRYKVRRSKQFKS